jgi:hypothetical protein
MAHKILNIKYLLFFGLMLQLVACGVPEVRTPAPTPLAIKLIYPPALTPWADKFTACSSVQPLVGIYFIESTIPSTQISTNEIVLELGNPGQIDPSPFLSQLGAEQIAVVVNQDNDLSQLPINMLQSIYSSQFSFWENSSGKPIVVWVLPDGDPVRTAFDSSLMQSTSVTSEAMLAPDPVAMLDSVARDPNAIGYLPGSILITCDPTLVSKVKTIQLDEALEEDLNQPVIALTKDEPQGLMRELLVCVQNFIP